MNLSIIIPVYNEATQIKELLFHIKKQLKSPQTTEILLIDGGSTDDTISNASEIEKISILTSPKGRGIQMNYGARKAQGKILYFLHADSFPPKHFDAYINEKVTNHNLAGCFKMKFDNTHPWLLLAGWFTQFNLKFFRGGDQSLFIEKALFHQLKGFPEEHPIFEDFVLIRKLYNQNQFTVIQQSITSSSRRYLENGITKLQFHYWMLYLKKWFGASTKELSLYYKKHIK